MRDPGSETAEHGKMLGALGLAFQALALGHFPLQGRRLTIQIREHTDFRPQELRNDRRRNIVHRAMFVSLELIEVRQMHSGNEDDRRLLVAGVLADKFCELKSIELRHVHVDEDDGDIGGQQVHQGFACRTGREQVLTQFAENRLIGKQLTRLVIDHEDVDRLVIIHKEHLPQRG